MPDLDATLARAARAGCCLVLLTATACPAPGQSPSSPSGTYDHAFVEEASFSTSLPNPQPPVTTVVVQKANARGVLTEIRWSAHRSMGSFCTAIAFVIDGGPAQEFRLACGHQTARDLGAVYASGGAYRIPLGPGVRFTSSLEVRVYGIPFTPLAPGGGAVNDVFVAWRTD